MMLSSQNQVTVKVTKTNSKSLEGYLDLRCGEVQLQLHLVRKFEFPGESGKFCFRLQKEKKQNTKRDSIRTIQRGGYFHDHCKSIK